MAGNPLGLSTFVLASPFSDSDCPAAFAKVAELGYDVIEVCVEDPRLLSAQALRDAAEEHGLAVGICGAFGADRDLSAEDPGHRAAGLNYLRRCVELAAAVGSPHVAGPMYAPTGQARLLPPDERALQRTQAVESLRAAADHAGEHGIRLALEPLNRFETDLVNTVEQGLELCAATGRDNIGLLLDTFHQNIEEKDLGAAIRTAGERVFHFQVSENDRGTPGSGHIPWPEVFAALEDIGYRGQIVVESFLPTIAEIARAVSLWRPVAPSMDALAADGLAFLRASLHHH
ncbi:sugar phosphate isomerase/epimerase [Amycolatopsis acidiphila]|uniref:Sugar phosphate isomerase/epimerase n=1 Tax=Amycolatopsis acidiphila TaxID=715473 RepID=A0A558AJ69_9PSEU|nr:sugar phosphate isomerase/epimerase family protein [Amycolatopsis acidiphila]TVT24314.1 sugar phosphate isomerase/epimerase [Amycolatopsis acidiphila]UIJ62553.1 sugar phosphate isomerase/epimerase [Amycolatopsis acidiphila]